MIKFFKKKPDNKLNLKELAILGAEQLDVIDTFRDSIFYAVKRKDGSRIMWNTGKCVKYLIKN